MHTPPLVRARAARLSLVGAGLAGLLLLTTYMENSRRVLLVAAAMAFALALLTR